MATKKRKKTAENEEMKREKLNLQRVMGRNIRKYRKMRGYSQTELADKLHVTAAHITQIENGHKALSIVRVRQVADVLTVNVGTLFAEKEPDHMENISKILSELGPNQLKKTENLLMCLYENFLR